MEKNVYEEKTVALVSLLENEAVSEKIKNAESVEDVLAILTQNGMNITAEELKETIAPIVAINNAKELNEDDLDAVAGGVNWYKVAKAVIQLIDAIFGLFPK